jgi:hypothetical protein
MSVIKKMRRQYCVLWTRGDIQQDGTRVFNKPEIKECRWDDITTNVTLRSGEIFSSVSTIYLELPPSVGDFLAMLDPTITENPEIPERWRHRHPDTIKEAFQVRSIMTTPTFRNKEQLYTVHV